ncbi:MULTISPECIES: SPOR domain-containing protein [unclassified Actinotalea]|uniref:SPOR domain-containing protein n=1 Tax=unclassified Actinotalea TaxID=2638618 RepID=UPI0015F6A251|nr:MULTISPECIES: SPOR domain-containing protein [unclassified Actinotalea]
MGDGTEFWFNPGTGEIEEGRVSPWTERMGPYPTREAAQQALTKARARTDAWDEDDRRWRDG